ncbi:MAG: hypothetical protein EZS28_011467 [Streblomastix strix]|uniref:Uncharacterized protein n=1 Tax=Streblomastix strix TaxID=222440 RepID=A0A5J4WF96_9EUKA|nr:MAG: hypothetical protein EZS28_011467 [Streblomastix strix]
MKNENEKEQTDDPSEISDQLQHNYSRHRVWLLLNKHIPQRAYGGGISIEAEQEEEKMQFGLNIVRQGKYRPYIGRIMKQNQQIITSQENEGKFVLMKLEEEIISNQRIDTNEQQTNDLIDGFYTIIISLKETPRKVKDDLHFSLFIYSTIDQYDPLEVEIEHIPLIHPNQCPLISGSLVTKPLFLFGHNRTMSKYVVDKYTPIENNTEQQPVYSNNLSKVSFITSNILNTTISSDELQQKEQNQSERYKDEDGDDDYDMDRGAQIRKLEEEDLEVGRKLIGKHRVVVVKQTSVNRLEGQNNQIRGIRLDKEMLPYFDMQQEILNVFKASTQLIFSPQYLYIFSKSAYSESESSD